MEAQSEDRFSDLPNPVIHHIFSYLETNDIPRIAAVSRRFRDVCSSSPYLDLEADFLASQNCESDCQGFKDFVNRVLAHRNGVGIHRLRLSWFCNQPHYIGLAGPVIDNWVKYAAECNVQELEIGVFPDEASISLHFQQLQDEELAPHNQQDVEFSHGFVERMLHKVRYTRTLKLNTEIFVYYHQPGVFDNLKHLVVVGPCFEEDQDQKISPFLSGLHNLRTLTLKLDDDNNGEVDANVVALLWMRRQRYVAKKRKPQRISFCFNDNEQVGPTEDNEAMLKWILECEKALEKVVFYY